MRRFVIIPLLFIAFNTLAQYDEFLKKDVPLKDRVYVGGGFGLGFTNTVDYVAVSPNLGYRITQRWSLGVGVSYQYRNYKIYKLKTNDWGGSIFTRYRVFNPFFLHTEYEYINYDYINPTDLSKTRKGYSSILAGGGITQPITRNAVFVISALYNLTYSDLDPGPYNSPWNIRIGISAGF